MAGKIGRESIRNRRKATTKPPRNGNKWDEVSVRKVHGASEWRSRQYYYVETTDAYRPRFAAIYRVLSTEGRVVYLTSIRDRNSLYVHWKRVRAKDDSRKFTSSKAAEGLWAVRLERVARG